MSLEETKLIRNFTVQMQRLPHTELCALYTVQSVNCVVVVIVVVAVGVFVGVVVVVVFAAYNYDTCICLVKYLL